VVDEIKAKGVKAEGCRVDHSNADEVEKFARDYFSRWKHVDILCCNAGIGVGGNFKELTLKDWEWVMGINLWGAIYMLHYFVPKMIDRLSGSILITASGAGLIGLPGMAPYCTSKFAMVGLAESLRGELYKYNIKVSALCPGIINTNIIRDGKIMFAGHSGSTKQSVVEKFYKKFGNRKMHDVDIFDAAGQNENPDGIVPGHVSHNIEQFLKHSHCQKIDRRIFHFDPEC
jgi:short-subunit dehydrogenase